MFSVFAFETLLHYVDFDYEIHNSSEELNALTACRINSILWTDIDVTPLDLI